MRSHRGTCAMLSEVLHHTARALTSHYWPSTPVSHTILDETHAFSFTYIQGSRCRRPRRHRSLHRQRCQMPLDRQVRAAYGISSQRQQTRQCVLAVDSVCTALTVVGAICSLPTRRCAPTRRCGRCSLTCSAASPSWRRTTKSAVRFARGVMCAAPLCVNKRVCLCVFASAGPDVGDEGLS